MSKEVRYAWLVGPKPGRVCRPYGVPPTLQNAITMIRHELPGDVTFDQREWYPTTLLHAPLPAGTVERYPEFCPVYQGDEMVAILLR